MSETNKSYRIRAKIGAENGEEFINIDENLIQEYDTFEVLSVDIKSKDTYRLHNSSNGIVVGRVLANNGFGIPNAKLSIFVNVDENETGDILTLYPFDSTVSKDRNGVRYNLLPNEKTDGCHQVVGTFPSKRYALDNDVVLEVYDKYYKFTTKTNNSGDYLICGVPVGAHTLHMDLDLSDCGILSQRPRDFVYKGYTIEQFETPTKFKGGTDYGNLSQVFTQDQVVNVKPFWGNESLGESIGITRADINVNFKFEPTCVFIGSIVSDNASNGFSRKCIPTDHMGDMDELTTGEGKIEMIRKTPGGKIEEIQIKGNKLIDANGVWCYQIPMNLDYMVTDEYGNMIPTDNPERGIPTRASVRFRISMEDHEENTDNFFRAKVLVPHNPQNLTSNTHENYDYEFGTYTRDDSFRDLFWNNVYSVKSYIPRIQKNKNPKKENFSGIKHCQNFGQNNPMPYNNIRIKMPLMFTIVCALIKCFIFITKILNFVIGSIGRILAEMCGWWFWWITFCDSWWPWNWKVYKRCIFKDSFKERTKHFKFIVLKDGLCPDLENWYFAPLPYKNGNTVMNEIINWILEDVSSECKSKSNVCGTNSEEEEEHSSSTGGSGVGLDEVDVMDNVPFKDYRYNIMQQTISHVLDEGTEDDPTSIDDQNEDEDDAGTCLTVHTDYLISCVEMNLAQEYKVINFDFYNDWVNGTIYIPRWVRYIKPKTRFLWINWSKEKVRGCMDDTKIFSKSRKYTQQCAIDYDFENLNGYNTLTSVANPPMDGEQDIVKANNLHKRSGIKQQKVFGENGGICHQSTTMKGQYVYYLKPCEWLENTNVKINLFATDIILLGSFNDCDLNGIPQTFTHLTSSTYVMPTNLALTNMDTNGPLYATDKGTICIKNEIETVSGSTSPCSGLTGFSLILCLMQQFGSVIQDYAVMYNSASVLTNKVNAIDGSSISGLTLEREINFYKNTANYSLDETGEYQNGIALDTIAMTEAAGIAWNYTGPGQGKIDKEKMYYPGGHFLGISCVNAQTNLKSCINLSRICEIGANMSQRRDDVRAISENGTLKYTYTAPSGFIAADEITDTDFRSMFATLNKKRLIATKRNPDTGYRFYDFEYSMPTNFNGAFSKLSAANLNTPYNQKVNDVKEENLTIFGITIGSDRDDYDSEETVNTQIRTRENASLDYYLFRFGLTYDQLENDENIQKKRFLVAPNYQNNIYNYYLPQYENSYYFYFGLRFGATALDEFNKQFYSECDNLMIKKTPNLVLTSDFDFCQASGKIYVMTEGLSTPYQSITIYEKNNQEPIYVIDGSREEHRKCLTYEAFTLIHEDEGGFIIEDFNFGEYTISVIDMDGIEVSQTVKLGTDIVTYESYVCNFNLPIGTGTTKLVGNVFRGGYICVSNLNIDGFELEDFSICNLKILDGNSSIESVSVTQDENEYFLYGKKKDTEYKLVLDYKCNVAGSKERNVVLEYFTLKDNSNVQLMIGPKRAPSKCIDENDAIMSGMSKTWWWDSNNYNIGGPDTATTGNYKDRWFYKLAFFNRNKDKTPFDSNVFADGGKKVLWGTPQNNTGFSNRIIGCTEKKFEMQPGFSLDDKKSYYSTYGVNNCEIVVPITASTDTRGGGNDLYSNCIMHYCAQVYNGNDVCGTYRGTMSKNSNDEITLSFTTNDKKFYHEGYGCVFKPLPGGKLKFMIYDSSNNYQNMKSEIKDCKCNYGVFYPTFIYPVIKRPFFLESTYIEYTDNSISFNKEAKSGTVTTSRHGYDVVSSINNGVTYNKYLFDSDSYIAGFPFNYLDKLRTTSWSDMDGISESASTNRIVIIDSANTGILTGSQISYYVKEKDKNGEYPELMKAYSMNLDANFAESLRYTTEINSDSKTCINGFITSNSLNQEMKYYLCALKSSDINKIRVFDYDNSVNDGFLYVKHPTTNTYFVLCRYKKGDDYVVVVNDESDYLETIVTISLKSIMTPDGTTIIITNKAKFHFEYTDEAGEIQEYESDWVTCNGQIKNILKNLSTRYNLPLTAVKKTKVSPTYNGNSVTLQFVCNKLTNYMHTSEYYAVNPIPLESCNSIFGVGVLTNIENGNVTKVYKLYKDVIKAASEEYTEWGDGEQNIWLEYNTKNITAAHTDFTLQFSASSPTEIVLYCSDNGGVQGWFNFESSDGTIENGDGTRLVFKCYKQKKYKVNFSVKHNNSTGVTRDAYFNFENVNNIEVFKLSQEKAVGSASVTLMAINEEDPNSHETELRYEFSVEYTSTGFNNSDWVECDFTITGCYYEAYNMPLDYLDDMIQKPLKIGGTQALPINGGVVGPYYYSIFPNGGGGWQNQFSGFDSNQGTVIDSSSKKCINIILTR